MEKTRLYYLDWLRTLVVLSLIPFHAALTYTGMGDTYIETQISDLRVLPFLVITAPLGSFFMTLLFFVSGISAYFSFKYRGKGKYIKERVNKTLLPLVLGTIFICPTQAYFKALNEGFRGNLLQFIPEFFSGKIVSYLGYAHFWFLLYLFVFSMIALPLFAKWSNDNDRLMKISDLICKGRNIYIPIIFIIVAEILLRPFFPGMQNLIMDWANVVVYLSIFIFGFVFASDTRIQERLNKLSKISAYLFAILSFLYILVMYLFLSNGSSISSLGLAWAVTKGVFECSAIIFLIFIGKKYLNKNSSLLNYLSKVSFSFYIFHFLPVSMFTYLFMDLQINIYAKYLLVIALSFIFVFLVYEILVRRLLSRIKPSLDIITIYRKSKQNF